MQATSDRAAEMAALLDEFSMELSAGGLVVMSDFAKAESAYVHHSRVPVAVVAMALAWATFARGWFPKLRLVDTATDVRGAHDHVPPPALPGRFAGRSTTDNT